MLKFIDKIVCLISILAIICLLGAYTSAYIDPNMFVWPSLLGLAYPYLLLVNLILLFYWLIRWRGMFWAVLVILIAGVPTFMTYYGTADKQTKAPAPDLTVLSYNIRYFDVYAWTKQKDTKEKLLNYLNDFKGDVICLQEFTTSGPAQSQQELVRRLHTYPYHHIYKDIAIFSRFPLIHRGQLAFTSGQSGSCIYCDLLCHKDTVRLYSVHLESYKLGKKERQFVQDIGQGLKREELSDGVKNLFSRITRANRNRALQADLIKTHLNQSPHKVVLCGDFNDTPLSYTYEKIKKGLSDSFIEKGRGLGNTYIGEFPSFRIDYILHSPEITTVGYTRPDLRLSDHYPVKAALKLKNKPSPPGHGKKT